MYSESTFYMQTPIGDLKLDFHGERLFLLSVMDKPLKKEPVLKARIDQRLVKNTLSELKNYFSLARPFSKIPFVTEGTDFQKKVWHELLNIPLGETCTYGEIAKKLNSSPRAVGNACRKNPIQIVIPCHRVISAKGIGGYAGETVGQQINIKSWLLNHEGVEL